MTAVILTFHILIVLGLIVMVLLQRSDGGALGIGGGSSGGLMSGRSAANALTRMTSVLAAIFFATSLGLAILAGSDEREEAAFQGLTGQAPVIDAAPATQGPLTGDDLLRSLGADSAAAPTVVDEGAEVVAPVLLEEATEVVDEAISETPEEPTETPDDE